MKLGAFGPQLRSAALIYVVSLAAALGEGLMAAASVSSRVFNVPRWDPPPLAAPPPGSRATRPAMLASAPAAARRRSTGGPPGGGQRGRPGSNGSGSVEVRPRWA